MTEEVLEKFLGYEIWIERQNLMKKELELDIMEYKKGKNNLELLPILNDLLDKYREQNNMEKFEKNYTKIF